MTIFWLVDGGGGYHIVGGKYHNKWQPTSLQVFLGIILCKFNKSNIFKETSKISLSAEVSLHPN